MWKTTTDWEFWLFGAALIAALSGLYLSVTWKPEGGLHLRYVRPHEARKRFRVRLVTPIWWVLPGSVQGWLCGCPVCQGKEQR